MKIKLTDTLEHKLTGREYRPLEEIDTREVSFITVQNVATGKIFRHRVSDFYRHGGN